MIKLLDCKVFVRVIDLEPPWPLQVPACNPPTTHHSDTKASEYGSLRLL